MKKKIVSMMVLITIAFIIGMADCVGATNTNIDNTNMMIENEIVNTTGIENNTQWPGINESTNHFINDINDQLQNMTYTPKKDNRRAVTVTIIIIITVAIIAALVGWYYMTNQ
ncbi:MAG: hypothetical protein HFJ29_06790 [Clostridia bacterium]|nr:hypothetical protein [Clostridia bacterium]MCI9246630.1 hypothetical protein [Clostridia bacterium]